MLQPLVQDNFARGAVSGLGIVNLWAAVTELVSAINVRRRQGSTVTELDLGRDIHLPRADG